MIQIIIIRHKSFDDNSSHINNIISMVSVQDTKPEINLKLIVKSICVYYKKI